MKHNLYSPSSAHIWSRCLRSAMIAEESGIKDMNLTNEHMAEGTAAHEQFSHIVEAYLDQRGIDAEKYDQPIIDALQELDSQLNVLSFMPLRYNLIVDYHREKYFTLWVENVLGERIEIGGTLDFAAVQLSSSPSSGSPRVSRILVVDYKNGLYQRVYAEKNEQLILYAMGLVRHYEKEAIVLADTPVTLAIYQPRQDFYDYWTTTVGNINQHYRGITRRLRKKHLGTNLGQHCLYCPVKRRCPAVIEQVKKLREVLSMSEHEIKQLSDEDKISLLRAKTAIMRLMKEFEDEFLTRMDLGESFPNLTKKPIKKRMEFIDEVGAITFLSARMSEKDYLVTSLATPSQVAHRLADRYHFEGLYKTKRQALEAAKADISPLTHIPPSDEYRMVMLDEPQSGVKDEVSQ